MAQPWPIAWEQWRDWHLWFWYIFGCVDSESAQNSTHFNYWERTFHTDWSNFASFTWSEILPSVGHLPRIWSLSTLYHPWPQLWCSSVRSFHSEVLVGAYQFRFIGLHAYVGFLLSLSLSLSLSIYIYIYMSFISYAIYSQFTFLAWWLIDLVLFVSEDSSKINWWIVIMWQCVYMRG